jgi:tetratricopeptide (TPR) repeat protein
MPMTLAPKASENAAIPPSPEVRLKRAWDRYGSLLYITCGVVLLAILAKGGWEYVNAQKELGIQKDFEECTTPDAYRSFASSHPGHPLTGVAEQMIADAAFTAGKYTDAANAYLAAASDLPPGPVRGHAKLGLGVSLALSGKPAEAETNLRQILNDTTELSAIRCEAGYQLAELAVAAGRGMEVQQLAEQEMQIDAASPFAARTLQIRPPAPAPLTAPRIPTLTLPGKP